MEIVAKWMKRKVSKAKTCLEGNTHRLCRCR